MTDRVAVIDMGTNTWNVLIAEPTTEGLHILFSNKVPVKLAKDGIESGRITEEAMIRAKEALTQHLEALSSFDIPVAEARAFATSAMRNAENGAEFADQLTAEFGLQIEIIDGLREAGLIYKGVRGSGLLDEQPALIIDIGGGSIEFIVGTSEKELWKQSFDLGVSRLNEQFSFSDPLSELDKETLLFFVEQQLLPLWEIQALYPATHLIGSSGSFDSFVHMIKASKNEEPFTEKSIYAFVPDQLRGLFNGLIASTLEERLDWKGLVTMRADTIHLSACVTQLILDLLPIERISLSPYALKEGAIFERIQQS